MSLPTILRSHRLAWGAALSAALVAAGLGAATSPSSAAGLLPTTTTLTTSANPGPSGGSVQLTATIKVTVGLSPVTPTGSVTFTITPRNSTGTPVTTQSAPMTGCILLSSSCKAVTTLNLTGALSNGATVVASYGGDLLAGASSSAPLTQEAVDTTQCNADAACQDSNTSPSGTTAMQVLVADQNVNQNYQIHIAWSPSGLSCTTPGAGDTAVWDVTYQAAGKTGVYTVFGNTAIAAQSVAYRICYGSDQPFLTYDGTPAALVSTNPVTYEGVLPQCTTEGEPYHDNGWGLGDPSHNHGKGKPQPPVSTVPPPCVVGATFTAASGSTPAKLATTISAPAGDPKTTH
ncbi:hypothetical protein [Aeromicrobium terrae]|jgi:hypothetical protein|uniref:Ig-like domain repeat protein n=1 Tax=Aeromicrobium terrae TaxID=2498846 RepID=A0A5C8NIK4_9ACTN|nr:hypothetical protein [Aeromicrobium terrae]TXL60591.1 hypothetical protein FHP06_09105 [Aeromicrobium terrae]